MEFSAQGVGSAQDELSVTSAAREASGGSKKVPVAGTDQSRQAGSGGEKHNDLVAQQQQQAAQLAAAQQAAIEAELAKKSSDLEARAAAQAAKEQLLEMDRQRLETDKQSAAAAAEEAERLRKEAAIKREKTAPYSGPSSGSIVWQGEVRGTTLVTINGNACDAGQIVSGALPGVLVAVQPADTKHVGVAGAPAPSNSYRRLTLRIQGNGVLQEVIRWSIL
jgi:hypothetical protein